MKQQAEALAGIPAKARLSVLEVVSPCRMARRGRRLGWLYGYLVGSRVSARLAREPLADASADDGD